MKLKDFYRFCIDEGIKNDPRKREKIFQELKEIKKRHEKLEGQEKDEFDKEKLENPYSDTRILNGDPLKEVKNVMVGIDIETPELLLAQKLKEKGIKIDFVLAHHPQGRAYANFYEVMDIQIDVLSKYKVPVNVAEDLLEKRKKEVGRKILPINHFRAVDAAKLLDIPFMNVHTPADNQVAKYLQNIFDKKKPERLEDIVKSLKEIPEYRLSSIKGSGPKIVIGGGRKRAGKVFVDMTGGTEGSEEILEKLSISGVGTIVGMHMSEKHIDKAIKSHINVVIAGHMSSDTLGLNLLLSKAIKKFGKLKIISCSGFNFIRH